MREIRITLKGDDKNASGYIRSRLASTDEQVRNGLSIESQIAALNAWAQREGHSIVGEYIDAGISGKRPPAKRPALSRFFADVESGLAVDILAFCKLDRLFRSVKLYYQAMDVLDRRHIAWQAIQEDYETVTASGRMKVNIMLSVAENEADRTSERIKAVFDRKIEKGECVNPNGLPLGYKCVNKRVVPDDNADAARAVFDFYAAHGNKMGARNMLQTEYGIDLPVLSVTHMLRNRLYIGEYRGNTEYCQPLVSRALFETVQDDLDRRSTRRTPSGMTYLFTGLIVCKECGRRMCAGYHTRKKGKSPYYRCPESYMMHRCANRHNVAESVIERFLVDHLESQLRDIEIEVHQRQKAKKPPVNRAEIARKLDRLKDLYVDGLITKEQYKADYDKYNAVLNTPPEPTQNFEAVRKIIGADFRATYQSLDKQQKKTLWRAIIDHIELDKDINIAFFFQK